MYWSTRAVTYSVVYNSAVTVQATKDSLGLNTFTVLSKPMVLNFFETIIIKNHSWSLF
jgi:hypothetical protein